MSQVGYISDDEFDGLNLDDQDENEYQRLARAGMPLLLPWHRKPIRIGTGYHSNLQLTDDPWAKETPFKLAELMLQAKVFRPEQGTTSSFTSRKTSRSAESNDHLTLGMGAGVSPPIPVVTVSVMGKYDQQLQENSDSHKTSIRASCRAGCIDLDTGPCLTTDAIREIKYGGGFGRFCKRFGDYYVAGYRLGADTGLLLSASGSSWKEVDSYSVTAKVEVVVFEVSKTWEKEFSTFRSGRSMKLLGYDTLEGRNWRNACAAGDARNDGMIILQPKADEISLREDAEAVIERSQNLIERVGAVLEANGVQNGSFLTFKQCEALVEDGVVIELLLLPMARLRDVICWRIDDNII